MKSWNELFNELQNKDYCGILHKFLDEEYSTFKCYPPRELVFNAFKLTPLENVKVVIIGQDPYHEINQAMGLAFSVNKGIKLPPSLVNIYKEIENEFDIKMDFSNGDLTYLAKQGVLLLNSILSVREHLPMSHNNKEYKLFLLDILKALESLPQPIVYLLWGGNARKLKYYLTNPSHLVLEANHPSPLSANRGGWFNSGVFIKCNEYLINNGLKPINWCNKNNLFV